jgi:hypothetical protein
MGRTSEIASNQRTPQYLRRRADRQYPLRLIKGKQDALSQLITIETFDRLAPLNSHIQHR